MRDYNHFFRLSTHLTIGDSSNPSNSFTAYRCTIQQIYNGKSLSKYAKEIFRRYHKIRFSLPGKNYSMLTYASIPYLWGYGIGDVLCFPVPMNLNETGNDSTKNAIV